MQKAGSIIGTPVTDRDGNKLGRIGDFIVDYHTGRVFCALVVPANFYGSTNYFVAVPAKCFVFADETRAVADINKPRLLDAPPFFTSTWNTAVVFRSVDEACKYFDQPAAAARTGPTLVGVCGRLLGMEVNNRDGANIGRLSDLMIDLPGERMLFALVSFYGADQNRHAVPPTALGLSSDKRSLVLNVDDSQTASLVYPNAFLGTEMTDPAWVAAAYQAYGKELVFEPGTFAVSQPETPKAHIVVAPQPAPPIVPPSTKTVAPPVITTPKPHRTDSELSHAVMIAIVQGDLDDTSATQGVKINSVDGKVTLTGQVPSQKIKDNFGSIAEGVAGEGNVVNELEVH